MIFDLTDRQTELLEAIISEYLNSSEPVGSVTIIKKYPIKASAATIRNEMAALLKKGFLDMVHTSSGRIPTPLAYRYFLDELMEEEEIPVLQEVAIKQRLWPKRFEFEKLLRQAAVSMSDITHELSILTSDDGFTVYAGAVNLLDHQEFWDIEVAKAALYILDRFELLDEIFKKNSLGGQEVATAIGDEIGISGLSSCSFVFAPYLAGKKSGYVSVFGPARMNYPTVVPAVKYAKNLIEELGETW